MRSAALSFGAGILAAAALPQAGWIDTMWNLTPWSFPLFAASLYTLYRSLDHKRFVPAYLWAFGYFTFGLNWIGNALLIDGNDYAWAWPFALVGLPAVLSLYLPLCFMLANRLQIKSTPLTFAALFALAEGARGYLFTGFPWNLPAYFWSDTLIVFQTLALVGPYGLTFLTLWWGVSLIHHIRSPRKMIAPILTLALVLTYGGYRLYAPIQTDPSRLNIVLVQPNIPQSEKWDGTKAPAHFETHLTQSLNAAYGSIHPTAIIWPEAALPPSYVYDDAVRASIHNMLSHYPPGSVLFTGAVYSGGRRSDPSFYNGIIAYTATDPQTFAIYAKHHLVPFGEYIPFQRYIPLAPVAQFDNLNAGDGPRTVVPSQIAADTPITTIPPFRPLVCYEVIFSSILQHNRGDERWILNVTNDAWYGHSPGPYQHLGQARARAIERGLPLVRVASTGISAVFDPHGRLTTNLKYNHQSTRTVTLSLSQGKITPLYTYIGDIPYFFALVMLCFLYGTHNLSFRRIAMHKISVYLDKKPIIMDN